MAGLACGQLVAPRSGAVSMGHIHLNVRDVDQSKKFWVDRMGGTLVRIGPAEVVRFPGAFVMLRKSDRIDKVSGPVEFVAFRTRNLKNLVGRLKAGGANVTRQEAKSASLLTGEALRIDLYDDPRQAQAIVFARIHLAVRDPEELRKWYLQLTGLSGKSADRPNVLDLPGVRLTFAASNKPMVSSGAGPLEHLGLEVRGLEAFCKKLEKQGIKFERPYRVIERFNTSSAMLLDPAGLAINLTEGLARY